jgi:hypothetical protein
MSISQQEPGDDFYRSSYSRQFRREYETFRREYEADFMASNQNLFARSGGSADGRAYTEKEAIVNGKPVTNLSLIVEGEKVLYCRYSESAGNYTEPMASQIRWYRVEPAETCPSDGSPIRPLRVTLSFHSDNEMGMFSAAEHYNYVAKNRPLGAGPPNSLHTFNPLSHAALGWLPYTGDVIQDDPAPRPVSPTLAGLLARVTVSAMPTSAFVRLADADPGPPPEPTPPPPAEDAIRCRGLEFETDDESD